jgi:hypothetical protein
VLKLEGEIEVSVVNHTVQSGHRNTSELGRVCPLGKHFC